MKLIFFLLFPIIFLVNPEISEIRKIYPTATVSENASKELLNKLAVVSMENNKTLVAYKGASIVMMSKYIKKVTDKTANFKEGIKWVEYAVKSQPDEIEIRLIRLSIQENTPKILNYYKNIKEDKTYISEHYKQESGALKVYVKNFILHSKSFSESEKEIFK
jgi:hypothetical protein